MAERSEFLELAMGRIVLRSPFLSSILLSSPIKETTETATADTNGDWIRINPEFIKSAAGASLSDQVNLAVFILAHEGYHIALMHPFRREGRDAVFVDQNGNPVSGWNLACDGQINPMLKHDGFTLPSGCFTWPNGENMYAEEIYDELMKQTKNNPKISAISIGDVSDGNPEPKDGEGEDDSPSSAIEQKVKLKVQKALDVAKAEGTMPASMQRMVENAMETKLDWRSLLREAVSTIIKPDDYTWARCNRRYIHQNMYLPGFEGTQTGPIAVFIDTSGSVGGAELEAFLGELNGIIEDVNPEQVWVGCCDAKYYGSNDLEPGETLTAGQFSKLIKGGGGTAFSPCFSGLDQEGKRPDMAIYFTDLCGSDFGPEPNYPVIWVTTAATEAPWGRVIKLDL